MSFKVMTFPHANLKFSLHKMPEFDSILFDFDGVLADTEPVHFACWREILAQYGIKLEWDFYCRNCAGVDDREMLKIMASLAPSPVEWEVLWNRYPEKKEMFRGRTLADPPFAPGLSEFLKGLSESHKLAVVSSSGRAEIEPLLIAGGIRDYFAATVFGREAGPMKPQPEPYLLAAKLLDSRKPLVVEDSVSGIASGRAAGFEVLTIASPAEMILAVKSRLAEGGTEFTGDRGQQGLTRC
jgi:beta-phosphoglucomutase